MSQEKENKKQEILLLELDHESLLCMHIPNRSRHFRLMSLSLQSIAHIDGFYWSTKIDDIFFLCHPMSLEEHALQRKKAENLKQIFPGKEYRGLSPTFHIHVSKSELYIPTTGLPFLLEEICGPILGIYKSLTDT
jgi:hypothetical protein